MTLTLLFAKKCSLLVSETRIALLSPSTEIIPEPYLFFWLTVNSDFLSFPKTKFTRPFLTLNASIFTALS